ncbi:MAG: cytochrome c [Dehalococcoidia bacterium]
MDALRTRPLLAGAAAALLVLALAVPLALAGRHEAADGVARWSTLAGLVLLAGVPWLLGPVLGSSLSTEEARALRRSAERLAVAAGPVVIAGSALAPWLLARATDESVTAVLDTNRSVGALARLVLASVVAIAYAAGAARRQATILRGAALLAAATLGLGSHAVEEDYAAVGVLVAAAHALAAVALGGALGALLLGLRPARRERTQLELLRTALPRLALITAIAAAALAFTGVFLLWAHTGRWGDLGTAFGVEAILKGAVLLAVIAGGWPLLRLARRARPQDAEPSTQATRRMLALASGGVVVALVASVLMTTTATPRAERQAAERAAGIVTGSTDAGLGIRSRIAPGGVGPNDVRVELTRDGVPFDGASAVTLHYANLEARLGGTTVSLERVADGAWELAAPAILTVDGVYELTVNVDAPDGAAEQRLQFETGVDRAASRLNPSTTWWAGILALAGVGAAMVAGNALGSSRRIVRGEALGWTGAAVAAAAFLLWGRAPQEATFITNPIPATASSLAEGAAVYQANCARCHGVEFDGAGQEGSGLPAPPANLVLHFPQHPDGQHFTVISNGRTASGMPSWEGVLTAEEIWHVINYLRVETSQRAPTFLVP